MPGDRTEKPTQHRRDKARREGDILHSRELTAAAGTLAGVMALGIAGTRSIEAWRGVFAGFLDMGQAARWETGDLLTTMLALRRLALTVMGPAALVMLAVA